MAEAALRRIKTVNAGSGYRLTLAWERGGIFEVDLSNMIGRGGVFAPLSDQRAFAAVRVGGSNRIIEWPTPLDDLGYPLMAIAADALYARATQRTDTAMAVTMSKVFDGIRGVKRAVNPGTTIRT